MMSQEIVQQKVAEKKDSISFAISHKQQLDHQSGRRIFITKNYSYYPRSVSVRTIWNHQNALSKNLSNLMKTIILIYSNLA